MSIEWHYAPITGTIAKTSNDEFVPINGWTEHHASMEEFLRLRERGDIVLYKTITYGHPHFHGHAGRVDVYGPNQPAEAGHP